MFDKKKKASEKDTFNVMDENIEAILDNLADIYSNKNSDEYKSKGDITKSPNYENIEYQVAQLSTIKGLPENDVKAIKEMFNVLHRPTFKKMTAEYMVKPDDKNIVFTAAYTFGYRLLVGELSRIIASSEATENGFVYKPSKVERKSDTMVWIKRYTSDIDKKLDDLILKAHKKATPVQEAVTLKALGAAADVVVGTIEGVFNVLNGIFRGAAALNPVSMISAVLSRSYDKKVEKYTKISKEYEVAKKMYDEYKKIPEAQRKKKIEHRYVKMIEKYNIKMKNLKAQIDHYDLRSRNDAEDAKKKSSNIKKDDNLPKSSSTVDTTSTKDTSDDSDDFDF